MKPYRPTDIEPKWQQLWDEQRIYEADLDSDKQKYIAMSMFNYPSGAGIHIGHAMNYTISDVMARYKRQQGYESYHPVGWDAFGLPAENYAIKAGVSPQDSMANIIPSYHTQYKAMGWSNDWSKEISTHLPVYYKWTQWIFAEMFRAGLVYQEPRMQWWCTKCQTVLANEQVIDGKCWRHDAADDPEVAKKEVKQWFFKVTEYADEMLEATDDLDWSEVVKAAQKNWIGKSMGAEIEFAVAGSEARGKRQEASDSLKFTPQLTKIIIDGKKTSTIRLEPKNLQIGDIAEFMTRDGDRVSPFGYAKITNVRTMKLADIPTNLEGHEQYASHDEKLRDYQKYYGESVHSDTHFTIYDFEFDLASCLIPPASGSTISVFTTRPDTIFGATFLVLAPEHELVEQLVNDDTRGAVEAYVEASLKKSELERQETTQKTGVFTGSYATNPATGERIPIWVADYVLGGYGTGAIMAVPAHDERDYEFAEKYNLPIVQVVAETLLDQDNPPKKDKQDTERNVAMCVIEHPADGTFLTLKWHRHDWHNFVMGGIETGETVEQAARREVTEETGFVNMTVRDVMPAKLHSKFYAAHKDVNRSIITNVVYIKLHNLETADLQREAHEDFDIHWVKKAELVNLRPISELSHIIRWLDGEKNLFCSEGILVNSGAFDGMSSSEAREQIVAWLEQQGVGRSKVQYKIRDWSVSRQRYWGAPIPVVHCEKDGIVLVPDDQLPVELPELEDFAPSGDGRSALARATDWMNTTCPTCGGPATRETDTLDTYICSSWYFLRYFDGANEHEIFDRDVANKWMPIDFYNGGDHATAHMIYARFMTRFFWHRGLLDDPEPFKKFLFNGKVTASDGTMFSKSKGNGVDPLEIIGQGYGADALRTYLMFAAPLDLWMRWDPQGVPGTYRFLNRIWNLVQEFVDCSVTEDSLATDGFGLLRVIHPTIFKVTRDLQDQKYNTAIAAMMEATNALYGLKKDGFADRSAWQFALDSLVALVAPFAPHMADELWYDLGHDTSVQRDSWPNWDDAYLVSDTMTIIVQVNGKLRAKLGVARDASEDEIKKLALADENVQKFVSGEPKKVIYVKNKLVSIVA